MINLSAAMAPPLLSPLGFGCYRVSIGVAEHRLALRHAVEAGVRVIDTSANYADGASEELVGATLKELAREGRLKRSEIIVVTKGGYIQGSNYTLARERQESGGGFPDVVEYAPGLWHSIAPEFLHDQITRSLARLGMQHVDVYLLHNPEYYLSWAEKKGVPLEEARLEYYRRIRDAFEFLESEVATGRIRWYGISSNSFPHAADAADFTSLEQCLAIAEDISPNDHHFAFAQMPGNLLERGFMEEKNQSGGRSTIEVAREKGIRTLANRPLNAIVDGELIRLVDFAPRGDQITEEEIAEAIDRLIVIEKEFLATAFETLPDDPEGRRGMTEFLSVGRTMKEHHDTFGSIEHYNDVLSQHFAPRLGFVEQYLRKHGTPEQTDWLRGYLERSRWLFGAVAEGYRREAQARNEGIRKSFAGKLDAAGTLSRAAVRFLRDAGGFDTVLVGMRRVGYVDDIVEGGF